MKVQTQSYNIIKQKKCCRKNNPGQLTILVEVETCDVDEAELVVVDALLLGIEVEDVSLRFPPPTFRVPRLLEMTGLLQRFLP